MQFLEGTMVTTPKTIYWTGFPGYLTQDEIIDILKKDLLIIPSPSSFTLFYNLKKILSNRNVYFFNLDKIIKDNNLKQKFFEPLAEQLSRFIQTLSPDKCFVYSSKNLESAGKIFSTREILYKIDPFSDQKMRIESINQIANHLLKKKHNTRLSKRSSFRMLLLLLKYPVKIHILDNNNETPLNGYIKDLSLNGVGCILKQADLKNRIKLKNRLTLILFLNNKRVVLNSCSVSRITNDKSEFGVQFNINDKKVISEADGDIISSLLYIWLKKIILQYSSPD